MVFCALLHTKGDSIKVRFEHCPTALRYSLNTRMTHEAAYNRYRHELENIGIDSVAAFRRIIHFTQSLESAQRRKHLEEQHDGRWILV